MENLSINPNKYNDKGELIVSYPKIENLGVNPLNYICPPIIIRDSQGFLAIPIPTNIPQ